MPQNRRQFTLRHKLLLLPALFFLGLLTVQLTNLYLEGLVQEKVVFTGFADQILAGHKEALKATVQSEAASLAARLKSLKTREEQIAAIVAETDPVRFFENGTGYYFTYDLTGVRINVPTDKTRNNQNLIELKDENGFAFVKGLVDTAKAGGGFVSYHFQKQGAGIQPKLSYVMMIPGTDFLVGTGVYVDDVATETAKLQARIKEQEHRYRTYIIGLFTLVMIVTIAGSLLLSESIRKAIRGLADELNAASEQVLSASEQVTSTSQSLAEGASEQAAALEQTGASLQEVSGMTQRNAQSAQEAKQLAAQTRNAAETRAARMSEMNQAMAAIKAASDNIAQILKTIDEIAFQTNILALNAAVEAARAGEAGMGFAVVAEEVRNLAQRCAQSAKETAGKIEEAIRRSEQGVQVSAKAAQCLEEIVAKAREVDQLVARIASTSEEQSQGLTQVNAAVTQMDQVTQANAASAEETASAAEELNAQALAMKESVAELLKLVEGAQAGKQHRTLQTSVSPLVLSVQHKTNGHSGTAVPLRAEGKRNGHFSPKQSRR